MNRREAKRNETLRANTQWSRTPSELTEKCVLTKDVMRSLFPPPRRVRIKLDYFSQTKRPCGSMGTKTARTCHRWAARVTGELRMSQVSCRSFFVALEWCDKRELGNSLSMRLGASLSSSSVRKQKKGPPEYKSLVRWMRTTTKLFRGHMHHLLRLRPGLKRGRRRLKPGLRVSMATAPTISMVYKSILYIPPCL